MEGVTTPTPTSIEQHLAAARERYLRFVRSKIGDPELAEDVLQDAIVKALEAAPEIDDDERMSAWFYRVLRNAVVDAYRRRDVRDRRAAPLDPEVMFVPEESEDDDRVLCECFRELLPALKPEYAGILEALDMGDMDTARYAESAGLTASNLKVRRHRARKALRERLMDTCRLCADHGCLDCTCEV